MKFDYCEYTDGPQSFRDVSGRMILCKGGGGGGGDGGAAQREAERQARIAAGTEAVNRMFGVGARTAAAPTGQKRLVGYDAINNVTDEYGNTSQSKSRISADEYNRQQAQNRGSRGGKGGGSTYNPVYEDIYAEQITDAGRNADARQRMYDQTRENSRQFYAQQLEEDSQKAQRDMNFQKARQGIIGSSQSNDLDAEFNRRRDRGLIDVANRADSAATQFRTNDEQTRLNLISKIVAGMDQGSAVQNAINTMQTNASQANEAYKSQRIGNMFSDLLAGYNQGQYNAGMQSAQQQYQNPLGNFFNSGSSNPYAGEKSNG